MNKFSLVRMQIPETYEENFDVLSKGLLSGVTWLGMLETLKLTSYIFLGRCKPTIESLVTIVWLPSITFELRLTYLSLNDQL